MRTSGDKFQKGRTDRDPINYTAVNPDDPTWGGQMLYAIRALTGEGVPVGSRSTVQVSSAAIGQPSDPPATANQVGGLDPLTVTSILKLLAASSLRVEGKLSELKDLLRVTAEAVGEILQAEESARSAKGSCQITNSMGVAHYSWPSGVTLVRVEVFLVKTDPSAPDESGLLSLDAGLNGSIHLPVEKSVSLPLGWVSNGAGLITLTAPLNYTGYLNILQYGG